MRPTIIFCEIAAAVDAPVAFIIFRRPDLTKRVFERIRQARPRQLFIIADGPHSEEDWPRCLEARRVVEEIDWPCEVQRNYSRHNQGCRDRVVSGLDWVFTRVNEAVVIEDDCLPSPDFFPFCAELLRRYRDDERVMHIAGSNFSMSANDSSHWYFFSRYAHVWGWATWARAWRKLDLNLHRWAEFKNGLADAVFCDDRERKHWMRKLRAFASGERRDTWDYPWQFSIWIHNGLCAVPKVNLVSNIGHRPDGTHTMSQSPLANLATENLPLPLTHPPLVQINETAAQSQFYATVEGRRIRERCTWRYRLSKPLRVYRKLRQQFA